MFVQTFQLDPAGTSTLTLAQHQSGGPLAVGLNSTLLGTLTTPAEFRNGRSFILEDGSILTVLMVDQQVEVWHNEVRLAAMAPADSAPPTADSSRSLTYQMLGHRPEASSRGFAGFFSTHRGTIVSLVGFGLLVLSLVLPSYGAVLGYGLLALDMISFNPGAYFKFFPEGILLLLTGGIVAQGLVVSAFVANLKDLHRRGIPKPRVWRIMALVIPLLGLVYFLGAFWFAPGGSPVALALVVPIFGFLTVLMGMFWQRRIARRALIRAQHTPDASAA